jgi:hypothetical protein
MNVHAEPKDGEVSVVFRKTGDGYSAMIRFTDQYGIERAAGVPASRLPNIWKSIQFTLDGKATIVAPSSAEEGVKNVYDTKP